MPTEKINAEKEIGKLVITRVFDAPRELLFKVWTEPEHFMQWFGPKVFTTPYCTIDLRVGGMLHYCMRSPDGHNFWGKGIFQEIIPPERIVYIDSFADENGNAVPASHYGMNADWPMELLVTVTFEELDSKTKFTLSYSNIPEGKESEMAAAGWNESFDKLADHLATLTGKRTS